MTACNHDKVQPTFDEEAAKGMRVDEVRERWPRFFGECPDCGETVILYASWAHFVYGDW